MNSEGLMTLGEKQKLFMSLLPRLIDEIYKQGFECTGGDLWSKAEYKAHKVNSNHHIRLAIDLNLFKDGTFLTDAMAHKPFGEFWETLHPLCRWGGNWDKDGTPFEKGEFDANHYSIEHEGRY